MKCSGMAFAIGVSWFVTGAIMLTIFDREIYAAWDSFISLTFIVLSINFKKMESRHQKELNKWQN